MIEPYRDYLTCSNERTAVDESLSGESIIVVATGFSSPDSTQL